MIRGAESRSPEADGPRAGCLTFQQKSTDSRLPVGSPNFFSLPLDVATLQGDWSNRIRRSDARILIYIMDSIFVLPLIASVVGGLVALLLTKFFFLDKNYIENSAVRVSVAVVIYACLHGGFLLLAGIFEMASCGWVDACGWALVGYAGLATIAVPIGAVIATFVYLAFSRKDTNR